MRITSSRANRPDADELHATARAIVTHKLPAEEPRKKVDYISSLALDYVMASQGKIPLMENRKFVGAAVIHK